MDKDDRLQEFPYNDLKLKDKPEDAARSNLAKSSSKQVCALQNNYVSNSYFCNSETKKCEPLSFPGPKVFTK